MTPYYDEDGITIYHGDCREILLDVGQIGTAFVDPPYGVGFKYASHADVGGEVYEQWMRDTCRRVRSRATTVFVTPGISNVHVWPAPKWMLCWYKPGSSRRSQLPQPNRPQGGFNQWEPVLVYGEARFMHDTFVIPAQPQTDIGDHPCPKPLRLLHWLLPGGADGVVLDPFMGSGTTLVAAKALGRRAIGVEIDERYCEIAARRLSQGVLDFGAVS